MKPVTIVVGGDFGPTKSNFSHFEDGNLKALIDSSLLSLLESADYRIFNLELPLTDTEMPISKDGPNLIAPTSTINGIKLLNPVLSLANNHIMDQDEQGLFQTMNQLSEHKITFLGSGKNLADAARPVILEKDGLKIGIYACAEYEFSIAGENRAGANPFDPMESLDHIVDLKSKCDFVIVIYHGGMEHYRYPSPYLQKVGRKIAGKGADLVVCQHSHCIGAYEKYNDSIIVYGQGNFLFDRQNNEFWATSLLIKATFDNGKMSVDFIPVSKSGNGIKAPEPDVRDNILNSFNNRSGEITLPGFIESEFDRFCINNGLFYLGSFAGFGRILRKADSLLHGVFTSLIYSLRKFNLIQNFVECEAHRELFLRYLQIRRKEK
jgi:hypothetical protein